MMCPDCDHLKHPGRPCQWRECPACEGEGQVLWEYEVGGYSPDRWVEIHERHQECEACGGWGEVAVDPWEDDDAE